MSALEKSSSGVQAVGSGNMLTIGFSFQPGNIITISGSPYEVVRPIGKGVVGEVYEVKNLKTREHLALKHLHYNFAADPRKYYGKIKFLVAHGSPHPCFVWPVGISDFDTQTSSFCYLMPLVPNAFLPLARAIIDRDLLTLAQRLSICRQAAEAFVTLQQRKWVYGDISAKNILFTFNSCGSPEVKIIDCDTISTEAAPFGLEGSGCYRAPEIFQGAQPSVNSDAHSLASVLFHLLVGCNPLDGVKTRSEPFSEESVIQHFGKDPVYIFDLCGRNKPLSLVLASRMMQLPLGLRIYFQRIFSEEKLKTKSHRPGPDVLLQYISKY